MRGKAQRYGRPAVRCGGWKLLGTRCTPTPRAKMHSVTDRQADDDNDANSCVAVRSAKIRCSYKIYAYKVMKLDG